MPTAAGPTADRHEAEGWTAHHATALVLGETGLIIFGASGAGKSRLARALLFDGLARPGRFARLVGDDRVLLKPVGGRLLARPAARIAGKLECRGLGIVPLAHEPVAVMALCVDIVEAGAEGLSGLRMPEPGTVRRLCGVDLPLQRIARQLSVEEWVSILRLRCVVDGIFDRTVARRDDFS